MTDHGRATVAAHLPYLRRYARALTGSQAAGDACVRGCLEALLADPTRDRAQLMSRTDLFVLFHKVHERLVWAQDEEDFADEDLDDPLDRGVAQRVRGLSERNRQVLLLTHTEGFPIPEVARIIGESQEMTVDLLNRAWEALRAQPSAQVLIIEDEPIIALDIAGILKDMGHEVIGVASTSDQAIALAKARNPSLVLADVQLEDGSTGIEAATKILELLSVPVVFVTAYPERLLTGERIEPAFLVSKPFEPTTLEVAVSQALLCGAQANILRQPKVA
ncbi:response regulator receiver domain-containing protein [Stella humosa]|uniref:Response regulator receiver domain-containing protein n=1 Tax=Stella humosa TaxID=94 RepID=A0A3N1M825_9PROT|nr:response regulator [Stella humosa]ROQ01982.1 response regulator receiver domain-containing protein [Stella humosa]BBK32371.1 two-component response regulator [Stella humosa]